MDPLYKPQGVEQRWQQTWEEEGLYGADPDAPGDAFVVMHPPPNISGSLTIGHCLQLSLEDTLVRWHRMSGFNTLFQPGYDHGGISTWAAIGRRLGEDGKTQRELGRDGFDAYAEEWLERYGGTIMSQFRLLGASLDYRRTRFTMDEGYYRAVIRWFVHLYERGFIYRANRIVNWCPRDQTALSDLEVEHEDEDDTLSYLSYPLADGSGEVMIATVRPATILADVAVAVHPDDERYRGLVGREVIVPFVERRVPVIADERVERDFGTGALKVTPGHDPTDFEIGRDHGLEELTVIGPDGLMSDAAGELAGLTQEEAGRRVLEWASEHGQLEKREHYRHSVGHCARCHSRIEPLVVPQWWLAMGELAPPAIAAVKEGRVRFTPDRFARVYLDWMENVRDWCISRQIWWGHRIPVWYCPDGHLTVVEAEPGACLECGSAELRQDEDVLDTWFSSALYPFATLGWPDETPELERYYPGHVLTTARDIIFLWVARMIFSGLELMGAEPFADAVIHSYLLNPDGSKMGRTHGTAVDPEEVLEPYGADATRYGLLKVTSSQDPRFSFGTIEEGRKLANKLWNASRLLLLAGAAEPEARPSSVEERWILARLDATRAELEADLAAFDFAHAVERLYHLTFDDFCDWYLESIKPRLEEEDVRATAFAALERLLKLLHPVMPHVTEEIWTNLPARETRLIVAPWPEPQTEYAADLHALDEAQTAARLYRRSGVRIEIGGDSLRIFEAVVRPQGGDGQRGGQGDVEAERARVQKEIERAERMLANEKFVVNAAPEAVEAERQKLAQYIAERDALG
jgi:valyl-tRNA synthetase